MESNTHISTATATSLAVASAVSYAYITKTNNIDISMVSGISMFILSAGSGAMIPDLDYGYSTITTTDVFNGFKIEGMGFEHRGKLHTLPYAIFSSLSPLIFGILLFIINILFFNNNVLKFFIGLLFGVFSGTLFGFILHLIEDTLTPAGIIWDLHPVEDEDKEKECRYKEIDGKSYKMFSLNKVQMGTADETIFRVLVNIISIVITMIIVFQIIKYVNINIEFITFM